MNKVYFTSDTYFYHSAIIKYCLRPFQTAEDMNQTIITNWNNLVKPEDTVFHLGDVVLAKRHSLLPQVVKPLNGTKILIRGNHDTQLDKEYIKAGFVSVYNYPSIFEEFLFFPLNPCLLMKQCHM